MVNYNVKINSYIDTESTTEEIVLEKVKDLVKELDRKNNLLINKNKNIFTKLYYISPLIGKLYIVVTEADAKELGLEKTILLNTNIKDYSYSKLPSKIIVYRELIIKKGKNITAEDELNLAQAIADNTFKNVAPFQIPIVKIINYNNDNSTTLVLPSVFGDNIFRVDDTVKVTTTGDSEAGQKTIDDLNEKEYQSTCNFQNGIKLSTYDISDYSNQYPENHDEYNELENNYAVDDKLFGSGIVDNINTATIYNNNPFHDGEDEKYLSILEGYINIPNDGDYSFAIDGDDAIELIIDDDNYLGWYGGHGASGNTSHNKVFALSKGYHKIKFRHQEWAGGDNYKLQWKKPGDSDYSVVPKDVLYHCESSES